jgi:hypothetical protein
VTYADLYDPAAPPGPPADPPPGDPPPGDPPAGSPPPPPAAAPDRRRPIDRGTVRLVLVAQASGVAIDIGLRGGPANAVVVGGLVLATLALVTDDFVERPEARALALAALLPVAFLAVRVSPWLIAANLAAAGALAGAAICLAQSGSLLDTTPLRLVRRATAALVRAVLGLAVLRPLLPQGPSSAAAERARRLALALAITVPLLLVVVALLASADAVFAGLLVPDVELGPTLGHVVLTTIVAAGVVCAVAAARGDSDDAGPAGRFGTIEIATMLGLVTVVMALFAVAQLVAVTSAGDRLVEEAGLTPAEYARSGFFQLCWAVGLIVAFLALVRGLAAPGVLDRPAMRALAAAVPLLALGLVAVSLRRMALYDEAFGLTMLRLAVVGAAVWMGVVLLLIAARDLGVGAGRDWVVGGATIAALVVVLVADVANPEAFVVHHNVDRAAHGAELDAGYLLDLSDDALPAYAEALSEATPALRARLGYGPLCDDQLTGVADLNLSAARADDTRADLC